MNTLARFLLFLCLCLTTGVHAQDFLFVKSAATFNSFRGNNIWPPTTYEQSLTSFQAEIGICDSAGKYFYPEVGLMFHGKGFYGSMGEYKQSGYYAYSGKFNLNYLTLSFQPNFCFGDDIKYFVSPGFFIGTLLGANLEGTYDTQEFQNTPVNSTTYNGSIRSEFQSIDVGLSVKNGLRYQLSPKCQISAEIGYYQSFNANKYGMKNSSVTFGAGVYLNVNTIPMLSFLRKKKKDTVQTTEVVPATPTAPASPNEVKPIEPITPSQWKSADPSEIKPETPAPADPQVKPEAPTPTDAPTEPNQWTPSNPNEVKPEEPKPNEVKPEEPKPNESNQGSTTTPQ
jgi:hypothetical protein